MEGGRGRRLLAEDDCYRQRATAISGGRSLLAKGGSYRRRAAALGGGRWLSAEGSGSWRKAAAISGGRRLLVDGGGYWRMATAIGGGRGLSLVELGRSWGVNRGRKYLLATSQSCRSIFCGSGSIVAVNLSWWWVNRVGRTFVTAGQSWWQVNAGSGIGQ